MNNIFFKTLPKRHTTTKSGVFYKEIEKTTIDDKGKIKKSIVDKVYSIQYKDTDNQWKFKTIGKYSEGIREQYCYNKRTEILNQTRLGEQPDIIKNKKKKEVISFDSIAQKYFTSVDGINRDIKNSIARYELHIKPSIGHRDITTLTSKDIDSIQKAKLTGNESKNIKPLAPKTVNHITTLIGTIINYGIQKEDLNIINPIVKVKSLKLDNQRERFLHTEEINELLKAVENDKTLDLFVRLALSTGGRVETILNIKKKDIDLNHHTINLYDFKNGTSYKGFITDDLVEILSTELKELKANDSVISEYAKSTILNKLKIILDRLFNQGLDSNDSKNRAVVHSLRHTFASHLAMNGTPILTIQKLMNHKDIKMTLRYAKLAPDNGKIEVKELYK